MVSEDIKEREKEIEAAGEAYARALTAIYGGIISGGKGYCDAVTATEADAEEMRRDRDAVVRGVEDAGNGFLIAFISAYEGAAAAAGLETGVYARPIRLEVPRNRLIRGKAATHEAAMAVAAVAYNVTYDDGEGKYVPDVSDGGIAHGFGSYIAYIASEAAQKVSEPGRTLSYARRAERETADRINASVAQDAVALTKLFDRRTLAETVCAEIGGEIERVERAYARLYGYDTNG